MSKLLILAISFCSISLLSASPKTSNKTILAIVAHPDDEMAIAEVLVKYGRLGYKVYVMIATDGKYGTKVTPVPEGDSLATVRKKESICACEKMGIGPPFSYT